MSSSINTACKSHSVRRGSPFLLGLLCLAATAFAQDVRLHPPSGAIAGQSASIDAGGSGSATFYLAGPSGSVKRDVQLGREITLNAGELRESGRYVAVVCNGSCTSAVFYVSPAKPASMIFLVHPSRAPVSQSDLISGVAIPFDEFQNLVLAPATVQFQLAAKGEGPAPRGVETRDGIAWFRMNSGKSAGALQVQASIKDVTARRVVQQVTSDPCSLRIKGQRTSSGIIVETEPVKDCSGNPVPDGTIVTFTAKNGNEMSTVDAPVKQDVARARIAAKGSVVISAASGVVMGNELHLGAQE
jgi:hypothetical protein